jgi:hypothetical protein
VGRRRKAAGLSKTVGVDAGSLNRDQQYRSKPTQMAVPLQRFDERLSNQPIVFLKQQVAEPGVSCASSSHF